MKKLLIGALLLIPFISIILVIIFRSTIEPTNEEVIQYLRDIKRYNAKVDFIVKNSKGEEVEETIQSYSENDGGEINFGAERIKLYKDGIVTVKDNISNKEYSMDEDMDKVHSMSFMNKLLSYPIEENSIKDGQEEWGNTEYIEFTCELFMENTHLDKIKIFIDKNMKKPIGAIIFDNKGKEKMKIIYREFEEAK